MDAKGTVLMPKNPQLFCEKLVVDLEAYGLKINLSDPCVYNKTVGRKQLTLCWHVDNHKILCVNIHEVTKMI